MGFGDRKGWDAIVEGRGTDKKRSSTPPADKTSPVTVIVQVDEPPAPPAPIALVVVEPQEPAPVVIVLEPDAKRIRYHYNQNKLSAGLFVMRIGGELDEAAVKRVIEFIEAELKAVPY